MTCHLVFLLTKNIFDLYCESAARCLFLFPKSVLIGIFYWKPSWMVVQCVVYATIARFWIVYKSWIYKTVTIRYICLKKENWCRSDSMAPYKRFRTNNRRKKCSNRDFGGKQCISNSLKNKCDFAIIWLFTPRLLKP